MEMNLVKYAGEFWITLADYTATRATEGYSGHASVKAAVRTFVVKQSPDKYIAFRGEQQIKAIILENKGNPLFHPEAFKGHTRTAIIHWSMIKALDEHFTIAEDVEDDYEKFIEEAEEVIKMAHVKVYDAPNEATPFTDNMIESRSSMQMQLRNEIAKVQARMEMDRRNLEKLQHALSALESLEVE